MKSSRAIIGIGNKLMGDEGVGIHVVECLRGTGYFFSEKSSLSPFDIIDGGTGGMALLHILGKYEKAIIIDAADFGGRPGEVRKFVIANVAEGFSPPPSDGRLKPSATQVARRPKGLRYAQKITFASDTSQISLHAASLAGILELAKQLGTKLPEITIIAVQPEKITQSLELSPAVKNAVQVVVDELASLIYRNVLLNVERLRGSNRPTSNVLRAV